MKHECQQTFDENGNWTLPDLTKEEINDLHERYNYFRQAEIERNFIEVE